MLSSFIQKIRRSAADGVSALCALFMLCIVPLLFNDAFFDINRVKVNAVIRAVPVLVFLWGAAYVSRPVQEKTKTQKFGLQAIAAMALLVLSCIISCAMTGFSPETLSGSEGRYCGLYFVLSCAAAFGMIAMGRIPENAVVIPIIACAAACAALGFANAMGVDPLGFYERISKGQETVFLSTIGHFDFFGTFLAMLFPLAGGQFLFSKQRGMRALGFFSAVTISFAAMASRTDSALAGLHLSCYMLLALSGGSYTTLSRALALWAAAFAALPVTCAALKFSAFKPGISGLPKMLFEMHAGEAAAVLLLVLAGVCLLLRRRGCMPPGRKRLLGIMLVAFVALVVCALCVVLYFSIADTETKLGGAASFLRFNDRWGTLRGFAWIRSLRAFEDFSWQQKLFGAGMERTLEVLTPYFDNPDMLVYGVFNDPHCQPLQMLLTCGIFGAASFVGFYACMLWLMIRNAQEDPLLCGVLGSLFAYLIIMLINVTQPILIATYFSLCGLGVSGIRKKEQLGGMAS